MTREEKREAILIAQDKAESAKMRLINILSELEEAEAMTAAKELAKIITRLEAWQHRQ